MHVASHSLSLKVSLAVVATEESDTKKNHAREQEREHRESEISGRMTYVSLSLSSRECVS